MKRKLIVAAFASVALHGAGQANATIVHDAICLGLETDPYYWSVYAAVYALKTSGALTSQMECMDLGDTINDLSIPDGSFKDCICESMGWPAANPSLCSEPHDACTAGGPLAASSAMLGCQPTPTQDVAAKVCATDSFCCTQLWDSQCVSEAGGAFWSALDAQADVIGSRMDLTCDQKNDLVGALQVEANTDSAQLPCIGNKMYPSMCFDRRYVEFIFNGKCMGVSGGNMSNLTAISPWSCNANASNGYRFATDQAWTIDDNDCTTYAGGQYCTIRNGMNYNKCLSMGNGGSNQTGTPLVIYDCLGLNHLDQYWYVAKTDGAYTLINLGSGGNFKAIHYTGSAFNLGVGSQTVEYPVDP